jgi:chemotaxis signal transduction protein
MTNDKQQTTMTSSLSRNTTTNPEINEDSLRVIVFTLGDYYFALPINAIIQVTRSPQEFKQHLEGLGLVTLEGQSILLLNLHHNLSSQSSPQVRGEFLILTQTRQGQMCGIPIDVLPNLMEFPYQGIQPLPQAYRQTNLFGLARFVAFVQFEEKPEKNAIYLLDVDEAVRFLS